MSKNIMPNKQYRLWLIDFHSAMGHDEGLYILQSIKEPTQEECERALYANTYTGIIYFDSVKETFEKEFRFTKEHITLMQNEK